MRFAAAASSPGPTCATPRRRSTRRKQASPDPRPILSRLVRTGRLERGSADARKSREAGEITVSASRKEGLGDRHQQWCGGRSGDECSAPQQEAGFRAFRASNGRQEDVRLAWQKSVFGGLSAHLPWPEARRSLPAPTRRRRDRVWRVPSRRAGPADRGRGDAQRSQRARDGSTPAATPRTGATFQRA